MCAKPLKGDGQLKFDRDVVRRAYYILLANQLHDINRPVVTVPTRWCLAVNGAAMDIQ